MDKKSEKILAGAKWAFALLVLCVLLYFILGEFFLPSEKGYEHYRYAPLETEWVWVKQDGTRVPIDVPASLKVGRGEKVVIETVLPEHLLMEDCLEFRSSRQDMDIYVDGKLRVKYDTKDTRLFGKSAQAVYVFLDVGPADAGKTLRLEMTTDSAYSGLVRAVHYGERMGIWMNLLRENIAEMFIAVTVLILGLICTLAGMVLRFCYRQRILLEYMGWSALIAAVWLIANSKLRQLMFPNLSVVGDIAFAAVMLLPFAIIFYMDTLQGGYYKKGYAVLSVIAVADFVGCTLLHICSLVDPTDLAKLMVGTNFLVIVYAVVTLVADVRNGRIRSYLFAAAGIIGAFVAGAVQMILYFQKSTGFNGLMLCVGLIILMIASVMKVVQQMMQMQREKQQAIYASESKAQFLANMSHEIRTPINAVLGMDEMILRECEQSDIRAYAQDIQSAGRSLLALINDILDFSKIESGKLEILPAEYALSSLLNDSYNMVAMRAKEKGLEFVVENNPHIPGRLFGDEVRIRQIIVNFLTNAVKYTKAGRITLCVDGCNTDDDQFLLKIAVKDTGIGISKEDREKLFESFERVEESRNRNIEGTGLGLAITRQLVDLMDGTIHVESEYGHGSVFSVELPQKVVPGEPLGDFSSGYLKNTVQVQPYKRLLYAPGGSILVVDDVEMNLKVAKALLKNTGLTVDTAHTGAQCLALVREKKYHVIFLDHMMPDMDGIETLSRMRGLADNKNADVPVIMLTANAISGAREKYLRAGFADYLSKPMNGQALEQMLLRYLPPQLLQKEQADRADTKTQPSFLTQLDFLDTKLGMLYCGGSEQFYREILQSYHDSAFERELSLFYKEHSWDDYQIKIHGLKSASLSIGAKELSDEAKKLELAAKAGDISYIQENHARVMELYEKLLEKINRCISTKSD